MKTRLHVTPLASAILAGALSVVVPSALSGQEPTQAPQNQGGSQAPDTGQATENTFSGKVTKGSNGKFMLEDTSKSISFTLDNPKLAKKFEGKNVVVTGTLDETNNILHVKKIELAA